MVEYRSNRDLWKELNCSYCATTCNHVRNGSMRITITMPKHKIIAMNTAHKRLFRRGMSSKWRFVKVFRGPLHPIHRNNFWTTMLIFGRMKQHHCAWGFSSFKFKLHMDLNYVGQTRKIHPHIWQTPKQKYILNLIQPNPIQFEIGTW